MSSILTRAAAAVTLAVLSGTVLVRPSGARPESGSRLQQTIVPEGRSDRVTTDEFSGPRNGTVPFNTGYRRDSRYTCWLIPFSCVSVSDSWVMSKPIL